MVVFSKEILQQLQQAPVNISGIIPFARESSNSNEPWSNALAAKGHFGTEGFSVVNYGLNEYRVAGANT